MLLQPTALQVEVRMEDENRQCAQKMRGADDFWHGIPDCQYKDISYRNVQCDLQHYALAQKKISSLRNLFQDALAEDSEYPIINLLVFASVSFH